MSSGEVPVNQQEQPSQPPQVTPTLTGAPPLPPQPFPAAPTTMTTMAPLPPPSLPSTVTETSPPSAGSMLSIPAVSTTVVDPPTTTQATELPPATPGTIPTTTQATAIVPSTPSVTSIPPVTATTITTTAAAAVPSAPSVTRIPPVTTTDDDLRSTAPTVASDDEENQQQSNNHHSLPEILSHDNAYSRVKKRKRVFATIFVVVVIALAIILPIIITRNNSKNDSTSNDSNSLSGGNDGGATQPTIHDTFPHGPPTIISKPPKGVPTLQPVQPPALPTQQPLSQEQINDAKTERYLDIIKYLEPIVPYDPSTLKKVNTPQNNAIKFMTEYDVSGSNPLNFVINVPSTPFNPNDVTLEDTLFIERYALIVIFYATGGPNWLQTNYNFLLPVDICQWNIFSAIGMTPAFFGAICLNDEDAGYYTLQRLFLPVNNYMIGSLPPDIGLLTTLKEIIIGYNIGLEGGLPEEIKMLTDLDTLLLAYTGIGGNIIPEIGQLTKLTTLDLYFNKFSGPIPSEIGLLTNLEYLEIVGSNSTDIDPLIPNALGKLGVGGEIPKEIQQLTKLRQLRLSNNILSGTIDPLFDATGENTFQQLTSLYLSNNNFAGEIPASITSIKGSLTQLYLDDNKFTGNPLETLNELTNLVGMFLEDNLFTGLIDKSFLNKLSEKLVVFDASNNNFSTHKNNNIKRGGLPVELFNNFKNLTTLDLHGNTNIGGSLFYSEDNDDTIATSNTETTATILQENNALEYLSLHDCSLTYDTSESEISRLKALKHLDLSTNKLKGDIAPSLGLMTNLTYLFLANNDFNTNSIPDFLGQLTNLEELSLKNTNRIGTIPDFVGNNLKNLLLLDLDNNALTGQIPSTIGLLTNLFFLQLNRNKFEGPLPMELQYLHSLTLLFIDENDIKGSANDVFCEGEEFVGGLSQLDELYADCGGVVPQLLCSCCTLCCNLDDETIFGVVNHTASNTTTCNDDELLASYDGTWEGSYDRTRWFFSDDLKFKLVQP